jgi:hypothetical protein
VIPGGSSCSATASPADRIRRHIEELFADGRPLPEILEEVARLGAQLLMQAALEAEVTGFLGRDRYQRAPSRVVPWAYAHSRFRSQNRNIATGHFPEVTGGTQIVDLFHAREHLHDLARRLEFMLGDRKNEWLAARLEDLDYGDIDGIGKAARVFPWKA